MLPGALALIGPVIAIVALLTWAGRLMLHADKAEDVQEKLDAIDEEKVLVAAGGPATTTDADMGSDQFIKDALKEEFGPMHDDK